MAFIVWTDPPHTLHGEGCYSLCSVRLYRDDEIIDYTYDTGINPGHGGIQHFVGLGYWEVTAFYKLGPSSLRCSDNPTVEHSQLVRIRTESNGIRQVNESLTVIREYIYIGCSCLIGGRVWRTLRYAVLLSDYESMRLGKAGKSTVSSQQCLSGAFIRSRRRAGTKVHSRSESKRVLLVS